MRTAYGKRRDRIRRDSAPRRRSGANFQNDQAVPQERMLAVMSSRATMVSRKSGSRSSFPEYTCLHKSRQNCLICSSAWRS